MSAASPGPGMVLADTRASTLLIELSGVLMPGNVYAGKMSGASWCNLGTRCSTLCTCAGTGHVLVKYKLAVARAVRVRVRAEVLE